MSAAFTLDPLRRGEGRLERLWLRWTGPMGLAWIQRCPSPVAHRSASSRTWKVCARQPCGCSSATPTADLQLRLDRGRGSEFHALREFQPGLDPRQMDWKTSARHNKLIVKEFRVEQNQHIVAVLDTGRLMSEPWPASRGWTALCMPFCCWHLSA